MFYKKAAVKTFAKLTRNYGPVPEFLFLIKLPGTDLWTAASERLKPNVFIKEKVNRKLIDEVYHIMNKSTINFVYLE